MQAAGAVFNLLQGKDGGKRGLSRAARSCGASGTSDAGAPGDCPICANLRS